MHTAQLALDFDGFAVPFVGASLTNNLPFPILFGWVIAVLMETYLALLAMEERVKLF